MGKRSEFKRIDKDAYMTIDPRAVQSLLPHLKPGTRFYEPCVGQGHLVNQLVASGMICTGSSDIHPYPGVKVLDAFQLQGHHLNGAEYIITNPPWSRPILHPMITHFCKLRPTWLLFDADWLHTRQSSGYLQYLCSVISIGRLKWIPNSRMTGKDNAAWYLFDKDKTGAITFHGRT